MLRISITTTTRATVNHNILDDDAVRSSSSSSSSPNDETLAVISVCIPGDRFNAEYIDASLSNKRYFCDKWNATCILSRDRRSTRRPGEIRDYSPKWEKLHSIIQTMKRSTDVDWILWLDCDAAFTNFDIDWRVHLRDRLDRSRVLIASRDRNGINLGVFLVPNTPYSRFFVEMMLEERHVVERDGMFHRDQNALKNLLAKSAQLKNSVDDSVPQGMINSVSPPTLSTSPHPARVLHEPNAIFPFVS
ncbi:hypothetical protein ACHAXA_003979 [Cyclostephanos tholiformis]|uniref:Uncharacterized protein n=1 Tax=Cyclostephanos tholiformis TaxID=382380 RepID=A0ABD3R4F6_9STRA